MSAQNVELTCFQTGLYSHVRLVLANGIGTVFFALCVALYLSAAYYVLRVPDILMVDRSNGRISGTFAHMLIKTVIFVIFVVGAVVIFFSGMATPF